MTADPDHYRKLERMYHSAPANSYYDPTLRVDEAMQRVKDSLVASIHAGYDLLHVDPIVEIGGIRILDIMMEMNRCARWFCIVMIRSNKMVNSSGK